MNKYKEFEGEDFVDLFFVTICGGGKKSSSVQSVHNQG